MGIGVELAERGWLPDYLVRWGIHRLLRQRLREEELRDRAERRAWIESLRAGPIALETAKANEQHYELPSEFFRLLLGPRLKYSACLWPEGVQSLAAAEEAMLELTCRRAGIEDGLEILDLGCGWGSLAFWIAEHFPRASVLALSNSQSQRAHIEGECRRRGVGNLEVIAADINHFDTARRFDRVVSIEMFEHMRNYERLLARIAGWLVPDGALFVHVFCHRRFAYPYEVGNADDWMARHFFTGGIMPSRDLFSHFDRDLAVVERWEVGGEHYAKTLLAWLANLDTRTEEALRILRAAYGERAASRWLFRWRIFLLACVELFGYAGGTEWQLGHYRLVGSARSRLRAE